ncbi:MAG: hypothetical protein IJ719_21480 [Clostridia bacterium]|nr:hypothetical protein [Clostridia bacterium]
MTEEEKRKIGQFGYQPREEQRGYQPSNSKPSNSEAAKATVKSDGNVAQKK